MKLSLASLALAGLFASTLAAPAFHSQYEMDSAGRPRAEGSVLDKIRSDERFTRFVEVLEREKNLADELEAGKQTTVFAPTNEAFQKLEDEWKERGNKGRPEWRDLLKYHIAGKADINSEGLHAGALVPTNLRIRNLGDRHQRIRVFQFADNIYLNMKARIVQADIEASNGRVHAIDRVLCPPADIREMLYTVPTRFATTLAALERTALMSRLADKSALTIFAPSNSAWEKLGMENLKFLFSCASQATWHDDKTGREMCKGVQMLEDMVKNHVADSLAWSTDIMARESVNLRTMGKEELKVCAKKREEQGGKKDDEKPGEGKHHDVRQYEFEIRTMDGSSAEARIIFTDGLASNGAIQAIDNVIVGKMELPHQRENRM